MLTYKILSTTGDTTATIPISLTFNTKLDVSGEENIDNQIQSLINPIIDNEKEAYRPISNYVINFNFFSPSAVPQYGTSWDNAGFILPDDLNKNKFKKSLFLLEFYINNQGNSNNMLFSTTLSVYPNPNTNKGPDITITGGVTTYYTKYTINNVKNEIYNLFYNRDFFDLTNIQKDNNGLSYVSLYMKAIFLNASNGIAQYFVNTSEIDTFTQDLYFYEIRFYENYTYGFFNQGTKVINIYLYELVLN